MTSAVAIFVKTAALSPVKSRLAKGIGSEKAQHFYQLSIDAITNLLKEISSENQQWQGYFAVAEIEALNQWEQLPTLPQGNGGLGDRLHLVCDTLIQTNAKVFLVGADSPQLSKMDLQIASAALDQNDCVMIPARDGGFVLFGTKKPIPLDIWQSIEYSTNQTGVALRQKIQEKFSLKVLASMTDVDFEEDLVALKVELEDLALPTESQKILQNWLEKEAN